jgi:chromosome partitioning protein
LIIAIYNIKGGVGKTTTSINLTYTAAKNHKVLLWDLDIQGASSYFFNKNPKKRKIFKKPIEKIIKNTKYPNIDIIPADTLLERYKNSVKTILKDLKSLYDVIIIDAPAVLSSLTKDIVKYSDIVIVPVLPNILSLRTYNQLLKENLNKNIKLFVNGFENKPTHKEIIKSILKLPKSQYLKTYIPKDEKIERMAIDRMSVVEKYPKSSISRAYEKLLKEII